MNDKFLGSYDTITNPAKLDLDSIEQSLKLIMNAPNADSLQNWTQSKLIKIPDDPWISSNSVKKQESDVPSTILDLVPGSVPEDWHHHINLCDRVGGLNFLGGGIPVQGGWIYKNTVVHESAIIGSDCAVYDNAVIGVNVQIFNNCKIYGNAKILKGIIYNKVKIYGDVVIDNSSMMSVNAPYIHHNVEIFGNVSIFGDCYVRDDSKVYENVVIRQDVKIISSKVCGNVTLCDNSYVSRSDVSGTVVLFKNACIVDCTFMGKDFICTEGVIYSQEQDEKYRLKPILYRTQKAKGLKVLMNFNLLDSSTSSIFDINTVEPCVLCKKFVRPCPVTPRHGFVDSRVVKTIEEATKLIEETKLADPEAEIIAMIAYDPPYSGVWTQGKITIGPGNDGATSGKDTITIPISGSITYPEKMAVMCKYAGVTESPYVEILWLSTSTYHGGNYNNIFAPIYVQLRDGPKLPVTVDFIPEEFTVSSVVLAEGSLLEWEEKVKTFTPGTVVYHPGGSLSSHYSVHCVLNNIPVLISKQPKIEDKIRPCQNQNFIMDSEKIRQGFVYSLTYDISYMSATYMMLVGCHSIYDWRGKEDFLLGFSLGCAFRLTVIAGVAEYRHYHHIKSIDGERSTVYDNLWEYTAKFSTRHMFLEALKAFKKGPKPGSGGIGGPKWYDYGIHAVEIMNYLIQNDISKSFEVLNTLINAVHNGGWGFNKFANQSDLDDAAASPSIVMMKVAPILYEIKKHVRKMDTVEFQNLSKFFVNRRKWELDMSKSITQVNTDICGCEEHECLVCYPEGCKCKSKTCHDCGICGKCCTCNKCFCLKCKPEGCKCKNKSCHDCDNCAKCCGCQKHDCIKCYKYGCGCKSKKCHDCKLPDCIYCTKKSKITEVQARILGKFILIHYKRQGASGYETIKKEIPINNLDKIKLWISENSTSSSWTDSTTVMYAPGVWKYTTWMLGPFAVELPFPLGSCGCDGHTCVICYPKGNCPCKNKYCHDCYNHCCLYCFPDGCACNCKDCHKIPCICDVIDDDYCGCHDHDCSKCFPDGCDCSCDSCHDDGCDNCITPDEPEEEVSY